MGAPVERYFERNYAPPEDMRQTRAADRIKGRYLR
jgi:hypothetical protein